MKQTMQWNAERYATVAAFVPQMASSLVDVLDPRPGEHILDLGCGDGTLTLAISERGATVLGVDSSPEQLTIAASRGLTVRCEDAQALDFVHAFDAVFSNAALHWMQRPAAVLEGVRRALRPGGRFVAEMGGAGNIARIREALHAAVSTRGLDPASLDPWYFPTPASYATLLEEHGFVVRSLQYFERPTPFARPVGDWLTLMAVPFLASLGSDAERQSAIDEISAAIAPSLQQPDGTWLLDYVRLRFVAERAP